MITGDPRNILLADDSVFFRTKLSAILIEAGHNVVIAIDGAEVIAKVESSSDSFDLLILDLQMPNTDGFEVLEWMAKKNLTDKFPTLVITGAYEPDTVVQRLKALGVKGLMSKGFTPEQVLHRTNVLVYPEKNIERIKNRVAVSAPVDFIIGKERYTGFLLNISPTGLFLHTRMDLLTGTAVTLRFSLPGVQQNIFKLKGMVKWSTPPGTTQNLFGGSGITFSSVNDKDQGLISEFITKEKSKVLIH
ncbi:MAG: response regulator [Deltaproteobacteria bacterium]|nr:response regulator [Deltaproteobacteria bacterium]